MAVRNRITSEKQNEVIAKGINTMLQSRVIDGIPFICKQGLFQFNAMPFGLTNASATKDLWTKFSKKELGQLQRIIWTI